MLSDSWYVSGVDEMVKLLLKNDIKTYMYVLNYTIEGRRFNNWIGIIMFCNFDLIIFN